MLKFKLADKSAIKSKLSSCIYLSLSSTLSTSHFPSMLHNLLPLYSPALASCAIYKCTSIIT